MLECVAFDCDHLSRRFSQPDTLLQKNPFFRVLHLPDSAAKKPPMIITTSLFPEASILDLLFLRRFALQMISKPLMARNTKMPRSGRSRT